MKNNFTFDYDKYDFWPIYETIKKYYPIGIAWNPFNEENSLHQDYPGLKAIGNIIHENFYVQKNYRERWSQFIKFLKLETKKPIHDTACAFYPCFSGSLPLKKNKKANYSQTKELHFAISLLGPFYTIYGLDKSVILLERERLPFEENKQRHAYYEANHVLTVSPFLEYEPDFQLLQQKITEWFTDYKFVPYQINAMQMEGLVSYTTNLDDKNKGCVFHALFHPNLDMNIRVRGESRYGYKDWLKEKEVTAEEENNRQLLNTHKRLNSSEVNQKEVSLHKVWKYKSFNRLSPKFENEYVTFGMEPFRLLDLTLQETLLFTMEENEIPESSAYEVINNEIFISKWQPSSGNQIKFKISRLTVNELGVIVNLYFEKEDRIIQGDMVEMIFEEYE